MMTHLFRVTILINGAEQEQYTRRMTHCEAWQIAKSESAELAELHANWRVRIEEIEYNELSSLRS